MIKINYQLSVALCIILISLSEAVFYLPGVAPRQFAAYDPVIKIPQSNLPPSLPIFLIILFKCLISMLISIYTYIYIFFKLKFYSFKINIKIVG